MDDPTIADAFLDSLDTLNAPSPYSDQAIGDRFISVHGPDWRYVAAWGKWLRWAGVAWSMDEVQTVVRDMQLLTCELINIGDGTLLTAAQQRRITGMGTVTAALASASAHPTCAATVAQWDVDPWLLATPQGVIDLATGQSRPAQRIDYLSHYTAVAPQGPCPRWRAHLQLVTDGDPDMQAYLQRLAGYGLTGVTNEHVFAFCYGTGANGKSVFIDTLRTVMGSYGKTTNIEMFLETKQDRHPTEIADLRGARLVTVDEVKKNRKFDQGRINSLTSAKMLKSRLMGQDFFEFPATFKILIAGNDIPALESVDEATRRRAHIIPFHHTIPPEQRDPYFQDRLTAEYPGILAWMIEGCLAWQEQGLAPPPAITEATALYLQSENVLENWLDDKCELGPDCSCVLIDGYKSYEAYCESMRERPKSCKRWLTELAPKGVVKDTQHGLRVAQGMRLKY